MQYSYTPHGVCSRAILIDAEDGVVNKVQFIGGCSGNTQGIAALVEGMPIDEVVKRLETSSAAAVRPHVRINWQRH